MYSAFEDLHASSKCRHNYSVSCWPFSARAPPLLYPASSFNTVVHIQLVVDNEHYKLSFACRATSTRHAYKRYENHIANFFIIGVGIYVQQWA